MEHEHLILKQEGPVTRITLNRPERRNALSLDLMSEVIAALSALPEECRAVIVEGAGTAFSAGHDLAEMVGQDITYQQELFDVCTELMEQLHAVPQPVIAKVHGFAFAAGCQLVAACDLAIASDDARFSTPGLKIGVFCSTPAVPVVRAVGRKRAMHMLLTAEPIAARTALEWGLVNEVVPADQLEDAVQHLIGQILRFSPLVVAMGKEAFYAQIELDEHRAYEVTKTVMAANAVTADGQEGMEAFVEKRQPSWRGR
ncbi:MAG: enoyl-CoA hydratase [Acidimicrobiia bacterium]